MPHSTIVVETRGGLVEDAITDNATELPFAFTYVVVDWDTLEDGNQAVIEWVEYLLDAIPIGIAFRGVRLALTDAKAEAERSLEQSAA